MACPGTQKNKCDFSFASSFDDALSREGGISQYRERDLKNSGLPDGPQSGLAGPEDLTAEFSVTSKTAGAFRYFRIA